MVNVKPEQFQKIWSALITPTNEDESVNYEALERIVELQIQDGAEGFYCCGSSGEGLLLTLEERKQVLEHVLKAADGRVPVISHVGTIRTRDVVDLARHAMSAGALAVSMIPPYYYKFSMDEIMGYYEDMIRAIPDVPAIVYNIPQFTGVEFSKENAGRLLSNENIVGIKHTSTNLYSLERMGQAFPGKALINGFDEQLLGALAMGSCATIGTTVNLFAPLFHRVRDAFDRGDMAQAYRWQHAINLRVEETVKLGIFNAMKYGWTLRGVDCGFCRAPFRPLDGAAREKMAQLMALPLAPVSAPGPPDPNPNPKQTARARRGSRPGRAHSIEAAGPASREHGGETSFQAGERNDFCGIRGTLVVKWGRSFGLGLRTQASEKKGNPR